MAKAFANISFTENVKQVQTEMGSRRTYQPLEQGSIEQTALGNRERSFIKMRDSFYMATVSETGWPYLQHRGGPPGFLRVLDDQTIGFADFSGNRQYLSLGNMRGDDRVSLFLISYPEQRRLKIWGRAKSVRESEAPELIAKLEFAEYRAPIEHGIVITVEAFDWNCPKHITPRFTLAEAQQLSTDSTIRDIQEADTTMVEGQGRLPMVISGIRQLADGIRGYELVHREGEALPAFEAGAHISVPVRLADGSVTRRAYSLCSIDQTARRYHIAVREDAKGNGASISIHRNWQLGTRLDVEPPQNHFTLHRDQRAAVLIAAGIGITPIKAMAESLQQRGSKFELHYTVRTRRNMAFREQLADRFRGRIRFYFSEEAFGNRLDFHTLFTRADPDSLFYLCGPTRFLEAALQAAADTGLGRERINIESFA